MIKVSVLLKRKPGMSVEGFHHYWKDVHGPLLLSVPELMRYIRRYVQCHTIEETFSGTPGAASEYDGCGATALTMLGVRSPSRATWR
jgi:EthD domain